MTITTAQYKAEIEARIAAANSGTTLDDLTLVKNNADLWLRNNQGGSITGYASLESLIQTKQNALSGSSTLDDITLVGAAAFPAAAAATSILPGQIVQLNPAFPPDIEISGMRFVKNKFAVTDGYDPSLENHKSVITGFSPVTIAIGVVSIAQTTDALIAVGTGSVIRRSTDGGETWSTITSPLSVDYVSVATAGDVVIAVANSGGAVARSIDGGLTFSSAATVSGAGSFKQVVSNGLVFIIAAANSSHNLLRSTDGGLTWVTVLGSETGGMSSISMIGNVACAARVSATNVVRVSNDGGETWGTSATIPTSGSFTVQNDGERFYITSPANLYATETNFSSFITFTSSNVPMYVGINAFVGGVVYYNAGAGNLGRTSVDVMLAGSSAQNSSAPLASNTISAIQQAGNTVFVIYAGAATAYKSDNAVGLYIDDSTGSLYMRYA